MQSRQHERNDTQFCKLYAVSRYRRTPNWLPEANKYMKHSPALPAGDKNEIELATPTSRWTQKEIEWRSLRAIPLYSQGVPVTAPVLLEVPLRHPR